MKEAGCTRERGGAGQQALRKNLASSGQPSSSACGSSTGIGGRSTSTIGRSSRLSAPLSAQSNEVPAPSSQQHRPAPSSSASCVRGMDLPHQACGPIFLNSLVPCLLHLICYVLPPFRMNRRAYYHGRLAAYVSTCHNPRFARTRTKLLTDDFMYRLVPFGGRQMKDHKDCTWPLGSLQRPQTPQLPPNHQLLCGWRGKGCCVILLPHLT